MTFRAAPRRPRPLVFRADEDHLTVRIDVASSSPSSPTSPSSSSPRSRSRPETSPRIMRAAFSSNAAASRCVRNRSRASAAAAISVLATPLAAASASSSFGASPPSLSSPLSLGERASPPPRRVPPPPPPSPPPPRGASPPRAFLLRPRLGDEFRLLERLRRRAFPRENSPKRREFCALRRRSGERRFAGFVRRSRLRRRALRLARFRLHHRRRHHRGVLRGESRGFFSLELGGERVANLAEIGEDGDVASGALGVASRALGNDAPQHRLHPRVARARGDGEGGDTTGGGI